MNSAESLVTRYVALWNEPDADVRRAVIADLWREDGVHFVNDREVRGYAALEQRVISAHEKNVRDNGNCFRVRPGFKRLRDVVTFHWEMVPRNGETLLAVGLEFLVLDSSDRIIADYQFIVS
jgi:hypothetical protein